jgi:hypothetical protein
MQASWRIFPFWPHRRGLGDLTIVDMNFSVPPEALKSHPEAQGDGNPRLDGGEPKKKAPKVLNLLMTYSRKQILDFWA